MRVLGINAVFHDPAAAIVVDGKIVAAAEEERFTRRKHGKTPVAFSTWELPERSARWCLEHAGVTPAELAAINRRLDAAPGDLLLIVADDSSTAGKALGALRLELAERFGLVPGDVHDIRWITEFPAFTWHPDEQRWDATHHPFTAPTGDLDDPGKASSRAYDLVLDGSEIGGGSIRINRPDVQMRVFELLGIGRPAL